jgi:hypothetical protein
MDKTSSGLGTSEIEAKYRQNNNVIHQLVAAGKRILYVAIQHAWHVMHKSYHTQNSIAFAATAIAERAIVGCGGAGVFSGASHFEAFIFQFFGRYTRDRFDILLPPLP